MSSPERKMRRGPVVGFVAGGKTHAISGSGVYESRPVDLRTSANETGAAREAILRKLADGYALAKVMLAKCGTTYVADACALAAFIADPKHPLCYGCVSAIEDELTGEKS